jgi:hypothetical protein
LSGNPSPRSEWLGWQLLLQPLVPKLWNFAGASWGDKSRKMNWHRGIIPHEARVTPCFFESVFSERIFAIRFQLDLESLIAGEDLQSYHAER